jgi:glycosyltransferase involved in cell wall biosynthesis
MRAPRVTIAIPTRNRSAFLGEAIASCLAQTFTDLEVLVCDNASRDGTAAAVAGFADERIRYLRFDEEVGMVESWNRCLDAARGELIANLPDDDVCLPDRLARQVAVFDTHPQTGVVHGDAEMIDEASRPAGSWQSRDFGEEELIQTLLRGHNYIVFPSSVIHRRVFEEVGGYSAGYEIAADLDLWLRAAPAFRFRHTPGGPVVRFRRHEGSGSHESRRALEVAEVERAVEAAVDRLGPLALSPGAADERAALSELATAVEGRALALPALGRRLRERAAHGRKRILLTSFGYNDGGGGTIVPRLLSRELVRRSWDVTVFHAAVGRVEPGRPYQVREWHEDGVRLVGVHNRPHGLLDLGNPRREIDDPPITRAYAETLERVRPDVVHFHNLHNLGAALIDETAARGIPSYFSTHNYWLLCPRNYLFTETLDLCDGPSHGGGACASCVHSTDRTGYEERLSEIRSRFIRGVSVCLAVSEAMKRTLVRGGYPPEMIDVVRQAMPQDAAIWERVGRDRRPGRVGRRLVVGFFGSAYPHKGPGLLVEAAQHVDSDIAVRIHGEVPAPFADQLRAADRRGVVGITGRFAHEELPELLAAVDVAVIPSVWWDCAPLMVAECLAARVPVVGVRMGGIPEGIRNEEDGLTVDGRSVEGLAAALNRLAGEPGLLERLQAGIHEPRSFAAYIDELEAYYAGKRPGRDRPSRGALSLSWRGDQRPKTSLATINRNVCARLAADPGIALQRRGRDGRPMDPPPPHPAEVEVRHQWPPDFSPSAGRLAVIQPWEFGAIPKEWVEPIRANVDELWVPSDYVRRMYVAGGVDPARVQVVPNGVDRDLFSPVGAVMDLDAPAGTRFLFVGGLIPRKGADLLTAVYRDAFAGRNDVCLVIKDFGADSIYTDVDRTRLEEYARERRSPRIVYLHGDLEDEELASLYRACDVLVQPYRGEGFAMPPLEAMACGRPVIVTAGGPTDEFVPDEACWRIPATVDHRPSNRVHEWETAGRPFTLEPDGEALGRLLVAAAQAGPTVRSRMGEAARRASEAYAWERIADGYRARIVDLAARPPLHAAARAEPFPLQGPAGGRLLATPAWRGDDRLGNLLAAWVEATDPDDTVCLSLLADPRIDGDESSCTSHVLAAAAAAGADLDRGADVTIVLQPLRGDTAERIHAAAGAYVALSAACAGHERLARRAGSAVLEPEAPLLRQWAASAVGRRAA